MRNFLPVISAEKMRYLFVDSKEAKIISEQKYFSNLVRVRVPIAKLNLNIYLLLVCGEYHGCAGLNVFM